MNPTDIRDANWSDILEHLTESIMTVYHAWEKHGPGTTREVAQRSGIDLLTLRPRTTDLYAVGLVELIGRCAHDGVYRHVAMPTAQCNFNQMKANGGQRMLL